MNRTHPKLRRDPWVEGSLASWMAGVTLGVVLGVTLLIVTPRLMAGPGETAKAPTAAEQTTTTTPGGSATAESGNAEMGNAETSNAESGSAGSSSAESGSTAGGTADQSDMSATTETNAQPNTASTAETAETNAPTTETPADNQSSSSELPASQSPAVAQNTTGGPDQQDTDATAESVAAGGKADAAPTPNAAEGDAEAGSTIFASNCAGCHNANGSGGIGPSLLTEQGPKGWTLAQFTTVLREGKVPEGRELSAVMPRFSDAQLSDKQVADLLAHIKTLN
ncbi:c-type cytochrome [Deinococcus humi]|uniref:Mono/diheme cytochrome c family protein n=1 Tax=Deinococcus humi TaxID=662880 RepID=A0A7W8JR10_9DEIO|nr:c-type cytochrome [Deinococcus humi]MBB5361597.1 mono/diheme cytochrome c family protein [Deinococcus humi]